MILREYYMLKAYTVTRSSVYRVYVISCYIWSSIPYKIWFSFIKLHISYLINLKICIIWMIIYESVARSTVYKSKIFILFIVEFQKVYPILHCTPPQIPNPTSKYLQYISDLTIYKFQHDLCTNKEVIQ